MDQLIGQLVVAVVTSRWRPVLLRDGDHDGLCLQLLSIETKCYAVMENKISGRGVWMWG